MKNGVCQELGKLSGHLGCPDIADCLIYSFLKIHLNLSHLGADNSHAFKDIRLAKV